MKSSQPSLSGPVQYVAWFFVLGIKQTCGFPSRFSDDLSLNTEANVIDSRPKTVSPIQGNHQEEIEKQNAENDASVGRVRSDDNSKGSVVKSWNDNPKTVNIINGTQQNVDGEETFNINGDDERGYHLDVEKESYKISSKKALSNEPTILIEQDEEIGIKNATGENTGDDAIETSKKEITKSVENEMSKAIPEETTLGTIRNNATIQYFEENNGTFGESSMLNSETMNTTNLGFLVISENSMKSRNILDKTRVPHKETISEYSNRKYDVGFIYPFMKYQDIPSALQESEGFTSRKNPRSMRSLDKDVFEEQSSAFVIYPDKYEDKEIPSPQDIENTINAVEDIGSSVEDSNEFHPTNLVSNYETSKSLIDFPTHSAASQLDIENKKKSNEAPENTKRYASPIANVKTVGDYATSNKKDFLDNSNERSGEKYNRGEISRIIARESNSNGQHKVLDYIDSNQRDKFNNNFADTISRTISLNSSSNRSKLSEEKFRSQGHKNTPSLADENSSDYNENQDYSSYKFEHSKDSPSQGKNKVMTDGDKSEERSNASWFKNAQIDEQRNRSKYSDKNIKLNGKYHPARNLPDKPVPNSGVNYDSFEDDITDYDEYPEEYEFDHLTSSSNNDLNKGTVCTCRKLESSKKAKIGIKSANSSDERDMLIFNKSRSSPRKNSTVLLSEILRNIGANPNVNLVHSNAGPLLISPLSDVSNILGLPNLPLTSALRTTQNKLQDDNGGNNLVIYQNFNSGEFSQQLGNIAPVQRISQNGPFANVLVNQNSPVLVKNTFPNIFRNIINEATGRPIPDQPVSQRNNANSSVIQSFNVGPLPTTSQNSSSIGLIVVQNGNTAQANVTQGNLGSNQIPAQNSNLLNVFVTQNSDNDISYQTASQNNNTNIGADFVTSSQAMNSNSANIILAQNASPSQNASSAIVTVLQQSGAVAPLQSMVRSTNGTNILAVQNSPSGSPGETASLNDRNSGVIINQQLESLVIAQTALNNNTNRLITLVFPSFDENTGRQTVNTSSQVIQKGPNSVTVPQNSNTNVVAPQNVRNNVVVLVTDQSGNLATNQIVLGSQNLGPINLVQNGNANAGISATQQSGASASNQSAIPNFNILGSQNSSPIPVFQIVPQNVNRTNLGILGTEQSGNFNSNQIIFANNMLIPQNYGPRNSLQNTNTNAGLLLTQQSKTSNLLDVQNSSSGNIFLNVPQNVNNNGRMLVTQDSGNLSPDQILSSNSNLSGPQNAGPGVFSQNLPQNGIINNAVVPTPLSETFGTNLIVIPNSNLLSSQNSSPGGPLQNVLQNFGADQILQGPPVSVPGGPLQNLVQNFGTDQILQGPQVSVPGGPLQNLLKNFGAHQILQGPQVSVPGGPLQNVLQNFGVDQILQGPQVSVPRGPLPNVLQNISPHQILLGPQISGPRGLLPTSSQSVESNADVITQPGNLPSNQIDSSNFVIGNLVPLNSDLGGGVSQTTFQNFNSPNVLLMEKMGDLETLRAAGLLPNLNSKLISQQPRNVIPVQYLPLVRNNDFLDAQSLGSPLKGVLQLDNRVIVTQQVENSTTTQPGPQIRLPIFNISPNEALPTGIYVVEPESGPTDNVQVRQNVPRISGVAELASPNIRSLEELRAGTILVNPAATGGKKILVDERPRAVQSGRFTTTSKSQQPFDRPKRVRLIPNGLGSISSETSTFTLLPEEKRPNNNDVCSCGLLFPEDISSRDDVVTVLPTTDRYKYNQVLNPLNRQRITGGTTDGYEREFDTLQDSKPLYATFDSHGNEYVEIIEPRGSIRSGTDNSRRTYKLPKMTIAEKKLNYGEFNPRSLGKPNLSEDSKSLILNPFDSYGAVPSRSNTRRPYEFKGADHLADSQTHPDDFGISKPPKVTKLYKYEPKNPKLGRQYLK